MDVSQYLEIFIDETNEHLQTLSDCIMVLEKEPDNKYDKEAILVKMQGIAIGHVANSVHTVLGDSMSAGRIYDKFGEKAKAKVVLVTEHGTICKLCKKQASGIKKNKIDYDEELSFN